MIVMCNDCISKSSVPFHIEGGKCTICRSYNTTRIDNDKYTPADFEKEKKLAKLTAKKQLLGDGATEQELEDSDDWEDLSEEEVHEDAGGDDDDDNW